MFLIRYYIYELFNVFWCIYTCLSKFYGAYDPILLFSQWLIEYFADFAKHVANIVRHQLVISMILICWLHVVHHLMAYEHWMQITISNTINMSAIVSNFSSIYLFCSNFELILIIIMYPLDVYQMCWTHRWSSCQQVLIAMTPFVWILV